MVLSDGPAGVRGELWDERDPRPTSRPRPRWRPAGTRPGWKGLLAGGEARRKGVDVLLAPTVNLHRSPYGGRHFECFSEDPLLTARIGVAYVRGVQAGGVAATVKHFVANDSETQRFTLDVRVDERALRERYLALFEPIVREAGVWAVMAAYNSINGVTATEHLMLRRSWGGASTGGDVGLVRRPVEPAANAGLDLVMPGPGGPWGDRLVAAVRDGRVPEAAVDDKLLRLLRLAARVGAWRRSSRRPRRPSRGRRGGRGRAAESAAAGFVLSATPRSTPLRCCPGPFGPAPGGRARPQRRGRATLGGGSATVFPPYTVSRSRACGPPWARASRSTTAGVRSTDRLPVAPMALLRRPGGGEGVEVRFLAADGTVRGREDRTTGAFTWLSRFGPDLPIAEVAAVEVHTHLRAPEPGPTCWAPPPGPCG